ncbi:hypothetical protein CRG98_007600 [Punica granatum]|uniref:Uncharacterized protein n=1 Tax=Punica granatum TaxID=22663 RepID=A0A2I0KU34_PUNGR|nr:hypothetical protein CRG98_007600 [Punica granatum]
MISIAAIGEEDDVQETVVPFIIDYAPAEIAVASAPFVVEVPAKEPYQDRRVPWNYGGNVANMEQEMSAMGITRSGQVYQGLEPTDKGKAPIAAFPVIPEATPLPANKVTEQKAKAFMKVIKASKYKVVEQMGKSPAHISLLALLLSSEPHRDFLLKVLIAAQVPKEIAPDKNEEAVNSIFSNQISFAEDELPSEGKLITINGEENYAIYKETAVPYINIGEDQNLFFHSFEIISVIRDYGEVDPSRADRMIGKAPIESKSRMQRFKFIRNTPGKSLPIYFGEGRDEDGRVPKIEESLHHLENHQLTSVKPTEEINIGTAEEQRTLRIGTDLDLAQKARMIDFLTEYQLVFAWSYADMPGLDPSIVKHFLSLDTEKFLPKR